ncbi:unnamed protein product [Allacma fusca]|uniref:Uncharacterized protein n=1 Tax=Allacma fusca TaxID=39272 RepID=A0A8J2PTC3_9HEXA|nr:unnamed protein product [Allacma fusca]
MTSTFTSRLLKCKNYVKLRSRYRKLQTSVSDSETRLTTLDQNQQSIVEQCNKLLLTNVHVESIQDMNVPANSSGDYSQWTVFQSSGSD